MRPKIAEFNLYVINLFLDFNSNYTRLIFMLIISFTQTHYCAIDSIILHAVQYQISSQ